MALAHALAMEGCDLIITSRKLSSLQKVGREVTRLGARVLLQPCDVRDPASVRQLAVAVRRRFRQLSILINNAGVSQPQIPVGRIPFKLWKNVVDTNLTGTFLVSQALLPLMKRGGTIVNNLSLAAARVFPNSAAYNASKHGALGLTGTLREELRPRRIRVIAFMPGATNTDIWDTYWPNAPRTNMMSPETVAQAVVNALVLPENSTVEEITILPTAGAL